MMVRKRNSRIFYFFFTHTWSNLASKFLANRNRTRVLLHVFRYAGIVMLKYMAPTLARSSTALE